MTPCLNYTIKLIPKSGMEMFGSVIEVVNRNVTA